jgi:hypothetical protein
MRKRNQQSETRNCQCSKYKKKNLKKIETKKEQRNERERETSVANALDSIAVKLESSSSPI